MVAPQRVPFGAALRVWLRIGLLGFGGPAGQIALMQHELVDRRRWIGPARFLHALNFCMLLPGPEAQQLATYVGWLLHGTAGGLVAGILFVLPGAVAMLGLSLLYALYGDVSWVAAIFYGLKPAVIAIVAEAVLRIGSRALGHPLRVAIAVAAFIAIGLYAVPFPLIVIAAGLLGLASRAAGFRTFNSATEAAPRPATGAEFVLADDAPLPEQHRPSPARAARLLVAGLLLWWMPVIAIGLALGWDHVLARLGLFFGWAAAVSFGGAYALLAYVAQAAVHTYGWLDPRQMLDGLALAETTPGPLILVTQFVGFLAGFGHSGPLGPVPAGTLGAALVTWVTFTPSFLWIFLGAPHVETQRGNLRLGAALSAITAAVVGVILNLSVWFGLHALFGRLGEARVLGARVPVSDPSSLDGFALLIAILAFAALWRLRWNLVAVIAAAAALGLLASLMRG